MRLTCVQHNVLFHLLDKPGFVANMYRPVLSNDIFQLDSNTQKYVPLERGYLKGGSEILRSGNNKHKQT